MENPKKENILTLLQKENSFSIPPFQRNYSWSDTQCKQLLEDLKNLEDKNASSFFGIVMLFKDKNGNNIIIDGQQRLTTISILLKSLEIDNSSTLLFNADTPKIKPIKADREIYNAIILNNNNDIYKNHKEHNLYKNYQFFKNKIKDKQHIIKQIEKLEIVTIVLNEQDKPQHIFENLNAKGMELSNSDLIKNYLLISIPNSNKQEEFYENYWLEMAQNVNYSTDWFINRFLEYEQGKDVINETKLSLYAKFKKYYDNSINSVEQIETIFKKLHLFSTYYKQIYTLKEINNITETKELLTNILSLEGNTKLYPLMFDLCHRSKEGKISNNQVAEVLKFLENMFIRRSLAWWTTKTASTNFHKNLLDKLQIIKDKDNITDTYANELKVLLKTEVPPSLGTLYYGMKNSHYILKYVEIALSNSEGKLPTKTLEDLKDYTDIEHIMPQTLDPWLKDLTTQEDKEILQKNHDNYKHYIGNLTLVTKSKNSSLRNELFKDKVDKLKELSGITLNESVVNKDTWGETEIVARGKKLQEIVSNLYPYPYYSDYEE